MKQRSIALSLLFLLSAGCSSDLLVLENGQNDPPATIGTAFDSSKAGVVSGRVTWAGPIPNTPPFLYGAPRGDGAGFEFRTAENPNRPLIDTKTRAVRDAVVFLRKIDLATSRAWDLSPVRVEIGNGQIGVVQGERRGRAGFVRRGEEVAISSTESRYHVLRGRGDSFFSLALPESNRPVKRLLGNAGRVELSSGSGLYWARADLFVSDHPYFTLTDTNGRFAFDRVPVGKVEVVVWLPGWQAARAERDPDSTQVVRQMYTAPIERADSVVIDRGNPSELVFSVP